MTLYELTQEQLSLYQLLLSSDMLNTETGEIDPELAEKIELNGLNLEEKIKSTGIVYKQLIADAKSLKEEEENLNKRRKRYEKNAEIIKKRLQNSMLTLGRDKFNDPKVSISFRASTRVEISDEKLIPKEYMTESITYSPAKALISTAIKRGEEVPGAKLLEIQNIQIN